MDSVELPVSLVWKNGELWLLDQTRLPHDVHYEQQLTVEQVWESIHQLKVRGAPAIGIAAAYGLCVATAPLRQAPLPDFLDALKMHADYLDTSRPTAVNLHWALRRMLAVAAGDFSSSEALFHALVAEAEGIHQQDRVLCQGIGEQGLSLIRDGVGVMTHCNAGALATGGIGTATAPLYLAHQSGRQFRVYASETRPLLQGARLTSWELQRAGIDVSLITDSMAAHTMASGEVDLVIVGTDRIAANGDVANKIGTLGLAILARHFGIPFYVACPSSTIDLCTADGNAIPIEQRHADEVKYVGSVATAAESTRARNPAFDITPAALVTAIITEKGIIYPPFSEQLAALFGADN